MKTIQIVVEEDLLRAADRVVKRERISRSALFRDALREHLKRRRIAEMEERERRGYERFPPVEFDAWDKVASWPEE
jgi:metal-responsive CopG/Arc/MetJ family transcriptional regulator